MAKPSKLPEWDTTQVNSLEPDQAHKDEGWLAPGGVPEKPPFQTFNYWQNEVFRWLDEINISGILRYDALTDYVAGISYVIGSDGNLYICWVNNGPTTAVVNPVGDATGVWSLFETNIYRVDASEADQGVTGNGRTIKAFVDAIGTSKKATLVLTHNGIANTTAYTLTTDETIPFNITLKIENGAILTGVGTLIQNGAFKAGLYQTFEPTFKVRFGPGVLKTASPQLWGAQGIGVTFDDSPAIDAMLECLMSAEGFSSWEIGGGNEIPGAAITGPIVFFPPGDYNYDGTGVVWTTGHRTLIMKAVQGTVRIRIADGIYLITFELVDNCFVEGINFYGGKGALKFNSTAVNVRGRVFVQHCWFSYYTECAMGNRSLTGMPYLTIRDNMFIGRSGYDTIGIAFGSRIDDTLIQNNSFLRNRYHIKLGGDGIGLSGNIYLVYNSFFNWDTGTDKIADIWLVPDDNSPLGIDSGRNLRIDNNKFGNENMQADDIRILVANEDTLTGTDRLSYHHDTAWNQTGHLAGISICNNHIQGVANITAPVIYSYCKNLMMWRFHDNLFGGIVYKYLVEFNGIIDGNSEQTLWSIRNGLSVTGNSGYQKISNEPLGIVNDPYAFAGGDIAVINNYPTIGDDLGYASKVDSDIRTTGSLSNCTRANVADFYGGAFASTLTYSNSNGYWGSADVTALTDGQPAWIEVDIKQSAVNPMTHVKIGMRNWTTGMEGVRRLVQVPTDWRTIRIPFVAPKSASGAWKLVVWGVQYALGVTENIDVGRPKIYQAHQAVNSGNLQIIGTSTGAGKWDGAHMIMGAYHLWIDATGDLRIKNSAPTSDTDGAVVGTQT